MQFLAHIFGFIPQLTNGQITMTALVWIGCFVWKASAGFRVPAESRIDKCLGVRVTSGFKVPEDISPRR